MGRARDKRNRGLPDNLYSQVINGKTYYRYRNPVTRKFHGLGTERKDALRAARLLNARLLSTPLAEELVSRVTTPKMTFADYADQFRETLETRRNRRGKPFAPSTLNEYRRYLALSTEHWGRRPLPDITRLDVSQFLGTLTANTAKHVRSLLQSLFKHAVAEGYLETNPVEGTLPPEVVVARQRLTPEQYQKVHAVAEPWLQVTMDLALETLQRRGDLVRLTASDLVDGYLYVRQQKTGVNVRMPLSAALRTKLPAQGHLVQRNGKSVQPGYLSRAFAAARDQIPELSAQRPALRPTFHELRALGALLLEREGINPQARLGHLEEKTTRVYLDRHKERWIDA
jgi:hypothetical protein